MTDHVIVGNEAQKLIDKYVKERERDEIVNGLEESLSLLRKEIKERTS